MEDLSADEILSIVELGKKLKRENKEGIAHPLLAGKTMALIFMKSSTRTRVSFEVGTYQLGGYPMFLSSRDLQMGRGEPIQDTARVLSRYVDGIMIRTFEQKEVEDLAKYASVPVINGLTDYCHPCQVLADLMTVSEHKGALQGLKLCFVGDGNNMANSLIVGCMKVGMDVSIACPKGYQPDPHVVALAETLPAKLTITEDLKLAARDADVMVTDVWASMGQEGEAEARKKAFAGFQINEELMACAKPDAMVLHCLPAHRGEEITEGVFESHAGQIFDEAENRLHAQKAVMVTLLAPQK